MAVEDADNRTREDEVDAVMEDVLTAAGIIGAEEPEEAVPDANAIVEEAESLETPADVPAVAPVPIQPTGPEPTLEEDLKALDTLERHIFAHRYASEEIETFGETIDPPKATADRAEALAVLVEEDHERMANPAIGEMLERLSRRTDELEPTVAHQVRILTRDRHQLVAVSPTDAARFVRLRSEAYEAWLNAKAQDDWRSFAPYLERLVSLRRRMAQQINPDKDPYDTLLDLYEPGTNRAFYNSFFAQVKQAVVPLLSSISMSGRTLSRSCIEGRFDEARQWELATDIARLEGIDEDAHYLTSTEHPFSAGMTSNYVVTAAHVHPDDLMSNVYTMLHEIGHNLYEQGVDPAFNRTSLKGGTSMGMHEAQSRFFENYVGRDRAFMGPLLDLMRRRFPGQLGRVTPNQLWRAVNRVAPTLIRTEADELTYPLHIVCRYEIEQQLLAGTASAREVPKLWAERYQKYIGANVTTDTEGALQDVHWSLGDFGYFPTYALGGAFAAQLRAKMISEGMDWSGLLAAADLAPIRAWLGERIWRHGRTKDSQELIRDACGEPFNVSYYADYLQKKYSALYGLR